MELAAGHGAGNRARNRAADGPADRATQRTDDGTHDGTHDRAHFTADRATQMGQVLYPLMTGNSIRGWRRAGFWSFASFIALLDNGIRSVWFLGGCW